VKNPSEVVAATLHDGCMTVCSYFCILPTLYYADYRYVLWYVFCQVGRTEMIKDTLNPDFVKHFFVDYFFEESQKIRFEMLALF